MPKIVPKPANILNTIILTYSVIIFLLVAIFFGFFIAPLAAELETDSGDSLTRSNGSVSHLEQLKKSISDDAGWVDPQLTSIAVLALMNSETDPLGSWENSNGKTVSLANEAYTNTRSWLESYISTPGLYDQTADYYSEIFCWTLLALDTLESDADVSAPLDYIKAAQDTTSGDWRDSAYSTGLAVYTISIFNGPEDPSVSAGVEYLRGQETDLYWGSVKESSGAILGLYSVGIDVSGEQKELIAHQNTSGSFGTVEETAFAVVALSTDTTGSTSSSGEDAQLWLEDENLTDTEELTYAALGESVEFAIPPEADSGYGEANYIRFPISSTEEEEGNASGSGEQPPVNMTDDSGLEQKNGGDDEYDQFAPSEGVEDDGDTFGSGNGLPVDEESDDESPSAFFSSNNLLWAAVAVIVIIFIVSMATWALIARVEEGRALDGVRRDIVEYIRHNPGEHFAGIMYEFDMSPSSTTYHLKVLEDTEQVVSHRDNKFKRYYIAGNTLSRDTQTKNYKELMAALRNATARKIVWYLLNNPGSNQKDVSSSLELHASTVNWHANRLKDVGIIEKIKIGKEVSYTIINEESVRTVMAIIEERT